MGATEVIAFPRGQLNAKDRKRLEDADIVFVEIDDPKSMHVVSSAALVQHVINGDDIVRAAIKAMADCPHADPSVRFVNALHKALSVNAPAGRNAT